VKIKKYRGWNTVTKTMVYLTENAFESWRIFNDGGFTKLNYKGECVDFERSDPFNPHILLDYTGWDDDSNTNIFEGGFVEVEFKEDYEDEVVLIDEGAKNIYEIVFDDGCFFLKKREVGHKFSYYISLYALDDIEITMKVLGNIYENKDLIGEKG
jgi:uncharacterized phage protein (TIGR01671 family)